MTRRIRFLRAVVFLLFVVLIIRLVIVQIVQHQQLQVRGEVQHSQTALLPSKRGDIFDRRGRPLALSVMVDSVYADPTQVVEQDQVATALSKLLAVDRDRLQQRLATGKQFVWIKRWISPVEAQAIQRHPLEGVRLVKEAKRFYPNRELAGAAIGFVGVDERGLEGVELMYDRVISGEAVRLPLQRDAKGRHLLYDPRWSEVMAKGLDVTLTIDAVIQYIAEKELQAQIAKSQAKGGVVVVMDPHSGEILAMASQPDFNPNSFSRYEISHWRERAITDMFEPGSTFKIVVASALLEEGLGQPQDLFYGENGAIQVGRVKIRDHERFGWLTFREVLAKSSNVGAIKMGMKLGPEQLYQYIRRFGFGGKTGIDLPGEVNGIVRPPGQWSKTSLAAISMGQEVAVTPLQLARAMAILANGGRWVQPRILQAVTASGQVVKAAPAPQVRQVLSERTARTMRSILEEVVTSGTGQAAAIPGYTVAGKTGTAQKVDPRTRRYSKSKFLASFAGFVPSQNPRLLILVMVDEPQKVIWGGSVAAPVFREIARQALRYLRVPPESGVIQVAIEPRNAPPSPEPVEGSRRDPEKSHLVGQGMLRAPSEDLQPERSAGPAVQESPGPVSAWQGRRGGAPFRGISIQFNRGIQWARQWLLG